MASTPIECWKCDKCYRISVTRECKYCATQVCPTCKGVSEYSGECWQCIQAKHKKALQEKLDKAELVENYDGWIWTDDYSGSQDGYFDSVESLLEYIDCECDDDSQGPPIPEFAFCCKQKVLELDAQQALENLQDQGYEDMTDNLSGLDELYAAVDAFNELNKDTLTVYEADKKRKIRIPRNVA